AMASELLAWIQMLALDGAARAWEPKAAAAAPVLCRRTPGPRRPPPAAAPRRDLALGRSAHRRNHPPASLHTRLTSRKPPLRPGKDQPRARGTPPTRRDSRATRHGQ